MRTPKQQDDATLAEEDKLATEAPAKDTSMQPTGEEPEEALSLNTEGAGYSVEDVEAMFPKKDVPTVSPLAKKTEQSDVLGTTKVADLDGVAAMGKIKQNEKRSLQVQQAIGISSDVTEATKIAKTIANAPLPTMTNGEVIAESGSSAADRFLKRQLAHAIDVTTRQKETRDNLIAVIKGPEFEGDYHEVIREENQAISDTTVALRQKYPNVVEGDDWDEVNSVETLLEFLNPIGGANTEGMDLELWETTKDVFTGDFDYDKFDERMESNFGNDWGLRFAGFLAKEAIVDGAILMAGIAAGPAGLFIAAGGATMKAKLGATLATAALTGVGGGSVQAMQNGYLGRDLDLGTEVLGRSLGAGVLGAVGVGVGALGKSAIKKYAPKPNETPTDTVARQEEVSTLTPEQVFEARELLGTPPTPLQVFAKTADIDYNDDYRILANKISQQMIPDADPEVTIALRKEAAKAMGLESKDTVSLELEVLMAQVLDEGTRVRNSFDGMSDPLAQKYMNSAALGQHLFSKIPQYDGFKDRLVTFIDAAGNTVLRQNDASVGKSNVKIWDQMLSAMKVQDPKEFAGRLAANLEDAKRDFSGIAKDLGDFMKDALTKPNGKQLNGEESTVLNSLLKEGGAEGKVFSPEYILGRASHIKDQASREAIKDSYLRMRFLLDMTHAAMDSAALKNYGGKLDVPDFSTNVGKMFRNSDDILVVVRDVEGKDIKVSKVDVGANETYHVVDTKTATETVTKSQLKEATSMVPYREGYSPLQADTNKFIITRITKDGKAERIGSTASSGEANKIMKELADIDGNDAEFVMTRHDSTTGITKQTRRAGSHGVIDNLTDEQKAAISKSMLADGVNPDSVNFTFRMMDKPTFSKKNVAARTELGAAHDAASMQQRIKIEKMIAAGKQNTPEYEEAKNALWDIQLEKSYKAPLEAINDYLEVTAKSMTTDGWRRDSVAQFQHMFAKVLNPNEPNWASPNALMNVAEHPDLYRAAVKTQRYLQRQITGTTSFERMLDQAVSRVSVNAARGDFGIASQAALKILDNVPSASALNRGARALGAYPKLLMFNPAQLIVQGAQVFVTSTVHPIIAAKEIPKMVGLAAAHYAVKSGNRVIKPKAGDYFSIDSTYAALTKSNIAKDLDTSDIALQLRTNMNPSPMASAKNSAMRMGKKALDFGASPFRAGEAINRVSAFNIIRRKYIERTLNHSDKAVGIKKLDGESYFTKADIDSKEFLQAVMSESTVFSLNMSKAGELEALSGFGSSLGQFKQIIFKMTNIFQTDKISTRDKFAAAAGMIGFFGAGAIPLLPDVFRFADWKAWDEDDSPSQRRSISDGRDVFVNYTAGLLQGLSGEELSNYELSPTLKNYLEDGVFAGLSDGDIQLGTRIGLGSFVSDLVGTQSVAEGIVSFNVMTDMIDAADRIGVPLAANPLTYIGILGEVMSGKSFQEAYVDYYEDHMDDSILAQLGTGAITLGAASQDALREVGKIHSWAGSVSRQVDALYHENINDEYYLRGTGRALYATSGLNNTDVEVNPLNTIQYLFGITPGKVQDFYKKNSLEFMYKDAVKQYNTDLKTKFKEGMNVTGANNRIRNKAIEDLGLMKDLSTKLGIEVGVANNLHKSLSDMITSLDRKSLEAPQ